jgi:anti-sigma28 factor (negative regulator of flagellin synthesis)
MTTIAAVTKRQPADRRRPRNAGNDRGCDTSPTGDVLMEHILENMNTTSQEEALKRIASVPDIRRDKVLDIRRQLAEGTYEVADRLDSAMDRVLEAIAT